MTDAAPAELALLDGIAQLLTSHGFTYTGADAAQAYPDDVDWPVYLGRLPAGRQAVAVIGPTTDAPVDGSSTRYGVQLLVRCKPTVAEGARVRQRIRDALHDQRHPPMPAGIRCTHIRLDSAVRLQGGAWDQHSLNFTALCARASTWAGGAAY